MACLPRAPESPSQSPFRCQLEGKLCVSGAGQEKRAGEKKRSSNLLLLKKKLFRRRKSTKSADHAKHMRDLLCSWDVRDVSLLVKQYEAALSIKELARQACVARPEASRIHQDLAKLYQFRYCTDVDLIFQGTCFPVHRAILAARCPFFRTLLSSSLERAELVMDIGTVGIDVPILSSLLHYLYSGEFRVRDAHVKNIDVLVRLSEEFGMPNALHFDIHGLLQSSCYCDAALSFTSSPDWAAEPWEGRGHDPEFRCHKAILCARSPFFRNLLRKRLRGSADGAQAPIRIVLNEAIIPKRYAKVILHCMYTDLVDLALLLPFSPSSGSLREAQGDAGKGGGGGETRLENAMELYHIALFIEFDMMAQGELAVLAVLSPRLRWRKRSGMLRKCKLLLFEHKVLLPSPPPPPPPHPVY
uniref:BTB domain-containing protein n=1 Tax=Callorhinchus milii TaxID=7868 RepID=A0A4W3GS57_CALMI